MKIKRMTCLLYTSDAADEEDSVDLGGRRIIKKNKKERDKSEHVKENTNDIITLTKSQDNRGE